MQWLPQRVAPCLLVALVGIAVSGCSGTSSVAGSTTSAPTEALASSTCRSAELSASIHDAQGAAGTFYYPVELTNTSTQACTLEGYPAVAVVNDAGSQVGLLAGRAPLTTPVVIHLSPGASAVTVIAWSDVLNACSAHVHGSGFRVELPGQPTKIFLAQSLEDCPGEPVMTVTPLETTVVAHLSSLHETPGGRFHRRI